MPRKSMARGLRGSVGVRFLVVSYLTQRLSSPNQARARGVARLTATQPRRTAGGLSRATFAGRPGTPRRIPGLTTSIQWSRVKQAYLVGVGGPWASGPLGLAGLAT
ncbi:hypothetical protein [Amycolatopsis sp. NPDC054798]